MTRDNDPRDPDLRHADEVAQREGEAGLGAAEAAGIVLHEERVRVRSERVATGRVTFRKRIVTEEQSVTVTVRREELEIVEDDAAFDEQPSAAPQVEGDRLGGPHPDELSRTPEGDFEIVLHAERPVVTVETVPVERVRIHRATVVDEHEVEVEVAREEAVIDRDERGV